MKKFEYKVVNFRTHGMVNLILTKEDEEKMNELGDMGWDLVTLNVAKNARNIMTIFKREIIDK